MQPGIDILGPGHAGPRPAPRLHRLVAVGAACSALAAAPGAAQAKTSLDEAKAPDPLIKVNRLLFYVGGAIDFVLIRPAAMTYRRVMPRTVRTGLANAFSNMGEPTIAINDMLQGRGAAGARSLARFVGNSTLGVAGLFDVATRAGLRHHPNDFGITLAKYGVRSGPYIFIPVLGPATVRDLAGQLVDLGLNPLNTLHYPQSTAVGYGRAIGTGLEDRDASDHEVKALVATSTDVYASVRSYYLQNRESQIAGGVLDVRALPDFDAPLPDQVEVQPKPR